MYWLAAFAASYVATGRYYRARSLRIGVAADGRVYAGVWLSLFVVLIVADSIANGLGGLYELSCDDKR